MSPYGAQKSPGGGRSIGTRAHLRRLAAIAALALVVAALPQSAGAAGRSNIKIFAYDFGTASCTSRGVHRISFVPTGVGSNDTVALCVTNVGTSSILVQSSISPEPPFSFYLTHNCDGVTLAANEVCYDQVWFFPTDPGRYRGSYSVVGDDGSSAGASLAGTAFVP
jgi:hypothetical protein